MMPLIDTTGEEDDAGLGATLLFLLPFAALYMAFGATFGLIGSGASLVFRARGMPLAEIGLIQAMYLPIGFSFLWAPLLDRLKWPGFPRRVGWIVVAQVATVALLFMLSRGSTWPIGLLFGLGMATSMAAATMDVSLEALVVETVDPAHRPAVTTAKLCGSSIGGMVGIGIGTMFPGTIDLPLALVLIGVFDALLLLPILRYPEMRRRREQPGARLARPTFDRLRAIATRALALGCYFGAALLIDEASMLVLIDLHLPLPVVGILTGPVTSVLTIGMTVAAGAIGLRFAAHRQVMVLAAGVAIGAILTGVATAQGWPGLGVAAALIKIACTAGLGVPVFTIIYRWAEGTSAATDYALLFGCAFLISLPARLGAPALAGILGWPRYFAVSVPLYLLAIAGLVLAMRGTDRHADSR